MVISLNNPEKYPKLIKKFELETGKNAFWGNHSTQYFVYWLNQKIEHKNGFICKYPDCRQKFDSKKSLTQHNRCHNIQDKTLSKDDPISMFFLNYMFTHTYLPNKIYKIYGDKINYPKDKINIIRTPFRSLAYQHMRLGVLERHSTSNYKVNKEKLKEYYGELNGKN